MGVEPISANLHVVDHFFPAMIFALTNDELGSEPARLSPLDEYLCLLNWDEAIRIAMDNQRGSHVCGNEVDRADLFSKGLASFHGIRFGTESGFEIGQRPHPHSINAFVTV